MRSFSGSLGSLWRWFIHDQRAVQVMIVLVIGIDLLLGLTHVVIMTFFDAPNVWRIDMDWSFAEAYQYMKYFWVAALLVWYARATRGWAILAWVPLIVFFLLDDAMLLHEQAGLWFAAQPWAFDVGPLSAQTVGELGFVAVIGAVLVIPIVGLYAMSRARMRWIFRLLAAIVVAFLLFAVVVDAGHSLVQNIRILDRSFGFIEDGGEMILLSLLVLVVFRLNIGGGTLGFSLSRADTAAPVASVVRPA
ncbi:hypothetical protein QSU92_12310 [Microbacterium sp. ET2]|uniref:hypothetical protein n=1 Tax=Microbacterium albipurpureum TaxID=3050384 RepID=UPI00259C98E7|nr:hypothetical protein [Microbacterium sp. ET2 (Ac-2212)]WJL94747.1 hypothetical protein QSU92_12310 [Microbacterium sp. ET2 (Ac-2212)]